MIKLITRTSSNYDVDVFIVQKYGFGYGCGTDIAVNTDNVEDNVAYRSVKVNSKTFKIRS